MLIIGIENIDKAPHQYEDIIFDKESIYAYWKKARSFSSDADQTGGLHVE